MIRVGLGYDLHPLKEGRALIIGGVPIPSDVGLDGHSDADVLIHAVCDALLGASGRKDLGAHFSSTDPENRGRPSSDFLMRVAELLAGDSWKVVNLDAVVVAQKPKLAPYLESMQERIAEILSIQPDQLSVKVKSPEGLGALGAAEGISAQAIVLIERGHS